MSIITDRVIEEVKIWQCRPLESVYPFMWLDAIHYKVKEDGAIKTKAVYCLLGVNREGIKDLLGLYISENEARLQVPAMRQLISQALTANEKVLTARVAWAKCAGQAR